MRETDTENKINFIVCANAGSVGATAGAGEIGARAEPTDIGNCAEPCGDSERNCAEPVGIGGSPDERMMRLAIFEAQKAAAAGEVPVGAVLIAKDGEILAAAGNRKEREKNPLRHAETVAMDEGIRKFGKYLTDCTLYVTLEPCAMCAGAMVNARLGRLVFGAYDKKGGAAGTSMDVFGNPALNHTVSVTGGVLEAECAGMLGAFFKKRREEKKCF